MEAFRVEAQRALDARNGDWVNLQVSRADTGEMVLNLLAPPGAPLQRPGDPATIREAVRTRSYTVSQIVVGDVLKRPLFAIRVPVVRPEGVSLVLSAVIDPTTVGRIVDRQRFPPEWAVAVVDGNFRFVVRRPAPGFGNEFASPSLRHAIEVPAAGWSRGELADGSGVYRTVQLSSSTRWAAAMSVPTGIADGNLRFLALLWGGFAIAGGLGLWFAWWLASGLSRPIRALAEAAPALGRGQPLQLPDAGSVDELRQLVRALEEAAAAIREREERQQAAEQALRATDRAKDEFLAMLGHELRNPLASVANASHLLRLAPREPGVIENVGAILARQVDQMTRLVDDLLQVGRVTGGKIRLESEPLDLAAVVGAVVDDLAQRRALRCITRSRPSCTRSGCSPIAPGWSRWSPTCSTTPSSTRRRAAGSASRCGAEGGAAIVEVQRHRRGHACGADRARLRPVRAGRAQPRPRARRPRHRPDAGAPPGRDERRHDPARRARAAAAAPTFTVRLPAIERPARTPRRRRRADAARRGAPRILIVEDNADARESLAVLLRLQRHDVRDGARTASRGSRWRAPAPPTSSCSTSACPISTATRSRGG